MNDAKIAFDVYKLRLIVITVIQIYYFIFVLLTLYIIAF